MMNKKIIILFLAAIYILFAVGCSSPKEASSSQNIPFAIYLVKNMKSSDAVNMNLKDIPMEEQPFLTDKDIDQYVWNEHKIILNEKARQLIKEKLYMKVPLDGIPIIVVCNGERIYLSAFWTGLSSLYPEFPTMMTDFIDNGYLQVFAGREKDDVRDDERIYQALLAVNKLK